MYRQVMIHTDDVKFQKILWRKTSEEPLETYNLSTVTYGTTSAPFLAVRSLQELAHQSTTEFPLASRAVLQDFYIDDAITGAFSFEEVKELHNQLSQMLKLGCFELRKWRSNCPDIFENHSRELENYLVPNDKLESSKTLGLIWDSVNDNFKFSINQHFFTHTKCTKRTILSSIAQIFDPLGLVGPVILKAKLILQKLWQLELSWDDILPMSEYTSWTELQQELPILNLLNISRYVALPTHHKISKFQLHGFSDASQNGYGACIYVRTIYTDGTCTSHLIASKSRVAPLKIISIPRLELCAALLLSQLMMKIKRSIQCPIEECHLWTDSTIVLCWLNASSDTWKIFVSHRVTQIHELTKNYNWHHVPTETNPADLISRGLLPNQLVQNALWWNGPSWLVEDSTNWPQLTQQISNENVPEKRTSKSLKCMTSITSMNDLFYKYSSITKLKRVVAYGLRFLNNARKNPQLSGKLSALELQNSLNILVKLSQEENFHEDISAIKKKGQVQRSSKLINLNPYIDPEGLMRVGGKIHNSQVPEAQKHPLILSASHNLTQLLIYHEHLALLHAGPQAVLASLRSHFWPLNGKNAVRKITRNCVICFKNKPHTMNPIMGNLPKHRVTPSKPFQSVGIDYAGPILIKESHRRGRVHTVQSYIAVFVCLSTKAVHLELITGLTTEAFLSGLKRFMARRGKPSHIYSDNATNFIKANKDLKNMVDILRSENHWSEIENFSSNEHITWHFIPPRSPTFGGLWEAAVKSLKHHIKRITGNALFTYEEYLTFLVQVEACLNSRPLVPMSDDPNDLTILTPSHFLLGDSVSLTPDPNYTETPIHHLTRWKHIQQLSQHFWKRWSSEYLNSLQQRTKWCQQPSKLNVKIGSVVLLKEENLAPLHWKLGRITNVFPGKDDQVRVVEVKTSNGIFKRAITKVCFLPMDREDNPEH